MWTEKDMPHDSHMHKTCNNPVVQKTAKGHALGFFFLLLFLHLLLFFFFFFFFLGCTLCLLLRRDP